MAKKGLDNWIKSNKAKGYSKEQLRDYLLKQGYNKKDVEKAINKKRFSINFKNILKPTPLKLFFPVLVFILLIVSITFNFFYINKSIKTYDEINEQSIEITEILNKTIDLKQNVYANPEETLAALQELDDRHEQLIDEFNKNKYIFSKKQFKPWVLGNLYFIMIYSNKINPMIPILPCEFSNLYLPQRRFRDARPCIFYTNGKALSIAILNSILLVILTYALVCFIYLLFDILNKRHVILKLIFALLLLALPILLNADDSVLILYPFMILFSILIFSKKESTRKLSLQIIFSLLIISMIIGLVIANYTIDKDIDLKPKLIFEKQAYKIVNCNNTEFINGSKVCFNPSCSDICSDYISKNSKCLTREILIEFKGNNPYCICGCKI